MIRFPITSITDRPERMTELALESLRRIESYSIGKNYCDYDQWFLLDSILDKAQRYKLSQTLLLLYLGLDKLISLSRYEIIYRMLKLSPICDPKTKTIFIRGYLALYDATGKKKYLRLASELGHKLIRRHLVTYKDGLVLRSPWRHYVNKFGRSYFDKDLVSIFTTALAGDALIELYSLSLNASFLAAARKIGKFFLYPESYDNVGDRICYHYVLGSNLHIHNANVFAGAFLAKLYGATGISEYFENGRAAIDYTLRSQNSDGSWYYYGPPERLTDLTIDNYHTGFVLMGLMDYYNSIRKEGSTNRERLERSIGKGLSFYRTMFTKRGAPKPTPNRYYPQNIHDAAQGVITFLKAENFDSKAADVAKSILIWELSNLRLGNGLFCYEINEFRKLHRGTFLRWCQSWMFYALALSLKGGILSENT